MEFCGNPKWFKSHDIAILLEFIASHELYQNLKSYQSLLSLQGYKLKSLYFFKQLYI